MADREKIGRLVQLGRSIFEWCLDLIYPRYCLGCRSEGVSLCPGCSVRLTPHPGELRIPPLDMAGSGEELRVLVGYEYGDPLTERLVHDLKYKGITDLGAIMGRTLADGIGERLYGDQSEESTRDEWFVTPIPLHRHRERERGFNQSALIGQAFASRLRMEYVPDALVRTRSTSAQAKLGREERLKNVVGAFEVSEKRRAELSNRRVLIVDDVCTTGATLQAAAAALRSAGCRQVQAAVFAHHFSDEQTSD